MESSYEQERTSAGRRRNLSRELSDEKAIKDFLHPRKRGQGEILRRIYRPVFADRRLVMSHLAYMICGGLLALLSAFIIRRMVEMIRPLLDGGEVTFAQAGPLLSQIGLFSLAFFFLSVIVIHLEARVLPRFMKIRMQALHQVMKKTTSMELGLAENARFKNETGDYLNAVSSTNSGLEGIYAEVFMASKTLLAALFLSTLLAGYSPWIPLIALACVILLAIADQIYMVYHKEKMPDFMRLERKVNALNDKVQDFRYGKDLRVYKMRGAFVDFNRSLFHDFQSLQLDLRRRKRITGLLKAVSLSFLEIGLFWALGGGYFRGQVSLSDLVMLVSIVSIYINQLIDLSRVLSFVIEQSVSLDYYFDFMDADLAIQGGEEAVMDQGTDIVFDHVYFRYPGTDRWVLEDLTVAIPEGESLALVGVNGAGKTTLVSLLSGLYQPDKGRILIGGVDISGLSQEALNRKLAIVLQSYEPLALKLKENVAVSEDRIRGDRVEACLKKVGLWDKVSSFEKGMDTMMLRVIEDEGMVLSGGENQKLAIARALYKEEAGILIMDEPTSALDAIAEQEIYQDFADLLEGKTAIFISHRLASTRFCDRIALLDGGKISQLGSHEDLISRPGLYRDMYRKQASYYQEGGNDDDQNR